MRATLALFSLFLLAVAIFAQPASLPEAKPHHSYKLAQNAAFTETEVRIARPGDHTQLAEPHDAKAALEPEFEIAGSLNVPKKGKRPWPAVLFISGSGPQDRHGFGETAPGKYIDCGSWQILDAIASAGFVVLRVDDRGTGSTPAGFAGIDPKDVGYRALLSDARFCLRWLQKRPEVDAKRVYLVGHSEGAMTAPILAGEENSGVAGVVCLAGPGRNLFQIALEQTEAGLKARGLTGAELESGLKVQKELQLAMKESREPDFSIVPKALWERPDVATLRKWWHEHFILDDAAVHRRVASPVLVVNGLADYQVNPDRDARALAARFTQGKCNDVTLKLYDDLDHLFKPCGGKPSSKQMYFEKRDVDKTFIADVVDWLKRH
jgi:pimeloyl-ACP methyl ester carboxylesterase